MTPKGHATRAFILQTAAEVFLQRGYAQTTLSELISRTGLAKGAFYFHFASKEQLAFAVLEEKQRQWQELVLKRILSYPTGVEQLRALGPAIIQLHREDPGAYSVPRLFRDLHRIPGAGQTIKSRMREWIQMVATIIERCQDEGALPPQLDASATATILVAATDGLKDLSDILDPPSRARRGFEQRMQSLIDLVELLITRSQAA